MLSHERFLIYVGSNETILVYDLKTHRVKAFFQSVTNGDLIESVLLTEDAQHLVQVNSDGCFYIYDLSQQARVLNGYYLDDEVVLFTDDGYYWATSEGAHFIFLNFPGIHGYPSFYQFQKELDRPDIIKEILANGRSGHAAPKINTPPTIELLVKFNSQPDSAHSNESIREIPVRVNAEATDLLAAIRLYRDGILEKELSRDTPKTFIETTLSVPNETRWITAVAVDGNDFESAAQTVLLPVQERRNPNGRLFAVIVGTDTYSHLSKLHFARSDARSFAAALQDVEGLYYKSVEVELLLDEPELNSSLRARIAEIKRKSNKYDTVMLYAAGHGLQDHHGKFYLAGKRTDLASVGVTAVSWDELADSLATLTCRTIVFLDACHSGASGDITTNDDAVRSFMGRNNAVTVISASKGRQFSQERSEVGGGLFTQCLTDLIFNARSQTDTNGNGVLELSEVFKVLKGRVARMTEGAQTPWIARNWMVGEVPLF